VIWDDMVRCTGTGCMRRGAVEWRWCETSRRVVDACVGGVGHRTAPEMLQYVIGGVDLRLTDG
jgi:hypothetical protein